MSSAVNVERRGSGPPLVLLHGWGMNLRVFDALAARLVNRFTVFAIDLPGHGRSAWPPMHTRVRGTGESNGDGDGDDVHSMTDDFIASVRAVLPPEPLLIGWSLGGQLALQLAADATLRTRALVLLHTTPRFVRSADWAFGLTPEVVAAFAAQLGRNVEKTVLSFLELQVRGDADAEATLAGLRDALLQQGMAQPDALQFGLQWLQDQDLRTLSATLAMPALVVGGQYDRVTPPQAQRALAALMPDAQSLELHRAGHASFLSHLDELMPVFDAFIASWERAG